MPSTNPRRPTLISLGRTIYGLPRLLTWSIAVFPFASSLLAGAMLALPATRHRILGLMAENRLVENLTVAGYWVGALLAALHAFRARSRGGATWILALLYSGLCFGAGAEEIGWGQQILHFRTPESLARVNVQRETTIHNLPFFHDLGSWIPLILAVAAWVAIVTHSRRKQERSGIPSLVLPYAIVIVLVSGYDAFTDWFPINLRFDILIGDLVELIEMLFAFAMALGIWLVMRRDARSKRIEAASSAGSMSRRAGE
jgi:hypothetical protein